MIDGSGRKGEAEVGNGGYMCMHTCTYTYGLGRLGDGYRFYWGGEEGVSGDERGEGASFRLIESLSVELKGGIVDDVWPFVVCDDFYYAEEGRVCDVVGRRKRRKRRDGSSRLVSRGQWSGTRFIGFCVVEY